MIIVIIVLSLFSLFLTGYFVLILFKKNKKINESLINNNSNLALNIKNLSKIYKGNSFKSLTDINLEIKKGQVIGLLGHNGAGKSTLIKCIVGQEDYQEGFIDAYGLSTKLSEKEFKKNIGYIPDHYILYEDLTGREYINYIADLYNVDKKTRRRIILYYLKLFHLTESFDSKIETYSFGMKQKIAIIATLVHEPKIWLLDEPLTGLDPESIYQVKKAIINHSKKGNVVLFSSHLVDLVEEITTDIIILNKGKLVYQDTTINSIKNYNGKLDNLYLEKVGTGN